MNIRALAGAFSLIAASSFVSPARAEGATITAASVIYDLTNNLLLVTVDFSSTTSAPTTTGIKTLVLDFDDDVLGDPVVFSGATSLVATSHPASITHVDPARDGITLTLVSAVTTSPANFSFLLANFDAASLDASGDRSFDLYLNYANANIQTFDPPPPAGFFLQGFEDIATATSGNLAAEAVPEPASLLLFGTGLAAAGIRRYRRKK